MMPFSYLISGGVSIRFSAPGFLYRLTRYLESKLSQQKWAMFAYIEIELLPSYLLIHLPAKLGASNSFKIILLMTFLANNLKTILNGTY
jgi:hypothetical protein